MTDSGNEQVATPLPSKSVREPVYSSVWTGKEMLVWGASNSEAYIPRTKQWRSLTGSLPRSSQNASLAAARAYIENFFAVVRDSSLSDELKHVVIGRFLWNHQEKSEHRNVECFFHRRTFLIGIRCCHERGKI